MKKNTLGILLGILTLVVPASAQLTPVYLRCDYAVNPLGVDSANPQLSWQLAGDARGARQTAYQIVATTNENEPALNALVWDSGKVESDATLQISFPGEKLKTAEPIFWKVRVWDENGKPSAWSKTATWTTGVFAATGM